MAEAQCPASCGELIQGLILGSEKLISCPINWFSTVEVKTGKPDQHSERPMMRQALLSVLKWLEIPEKASRELAIRYDSTIPIAKGMASSTADIAATAMATARHFGATLSELSLAKLCVSLEPTDSTLFSKLTLFDHNDGAIHEQFGWEPAVQFLILENPAQLKTADFHQMNRHALLKQHEPVLNQAWKLFQQSATENDRHRLGEATTLSAQVSQSVLPKACFHELQDLVEQFDLYGLNVAHSGTVIGLLCDPEKHDPDAIKAAIAKTMIGQHYPQIHHCHFIAGGLR